MPNQQQLTAELASLKAKTAAGQLTGGEHQRAATIQAQLDAKTPKDAK